MSHKSYITKIKPANTNAELKAQAIKGNLDQAQLARLADVNNLGEQADEVFKGVVSYYDLTSDTATPPAFHFHETADGTLFTDPATPATDMKGYYITFGIGTAPTGVAPTAYIIEVARVSWTGSSLDRLLTEKIDGSLGYTTNGLGYDLNQVSTFATGAEVYALAPTNAYIPTTRASVYWSKEDPSNPGSELDFQRRLYITVTAGGSANIAFEGLVRVDFFLPKDAKVTVVDAV